MAAESINIVNRGPPCAHKNCTAFRIQTGPNIGMPFYAIDEDLALRMQKFINKMENISGEIDHVCSDKIDLDTLSPDTLFLEYDAFVNEVDEKKNTARAKNEKAE